jgi:hypothetical protein
VSAYKGVAKFEGYLYVVVRRICINLSQKDDKQKKRINTVSIDDIGYQAEDPSVHADHRLMIKEAVTRFGIILNTYRNNRSKLIFCLKALYRFPVTTIGLNTEGLAPDAVKTIQRIVNEINDKSSSAANLQIYQQLALLFGTLERRTITDDAQRHWIDFYINQIIKAMNGEPPRSSFEKETFRLLFERWINNR